MARTRRLVPIALLACLSLAGCLGGPTGLEVDAYETSTVAVSTWSNDADRTVTVHLRVPGADATDRTLEPGEDDDRTVQLTCPRSGGVDVAVVDEDGTSIAEETIRCRPWPTIWSIAVSGADAVDVERTA